ncbi:aldehyde dehydrogenase family protein [Leucobacter sp. GX0328]
MSENIERYFDQYGLSPKTRAFIAKEHGLFIGGEWSVGPERTDVIEPSTGEVLTTLTTGTVDDLDRAVAAARRQFDEGEWPRMKPLAREQLLLKLADALEANLDEFAEIESVDVGKSLQDAKDIDIQGTVDTLRYFAGWASKIGGRSAEASSMPGEYLAYTRKEPVGVIGVIVPWNFPLQTLAWKLGAALAVGCTVVVKPAELTSLSALRFAELAQEVGIPDGVINIVTGRGSVVGSALAAHKDIDKITFTGSTKTGLAVGHAALENWTRMTLELGGKSPVIVYSDVDIEQTVERVALGIFANSGQVCDAGSRAYIHESIYDEFIERLGAHVSSLAVKPGLDPDCFMGPLVSENQMRQVVDYIEIGIAEGARLVTGGPETSETGFFVQPTVFADCDNDMRIVREEIFGPVLVCQKFSTEEEVVKLANDSDYGLAATIYSESINNVLRVAPQLKAGSVYVNAQSTIDPAMPFGGYKASGFGRDLGAEQLDFVTETKTVWVTIDA